MYNISLIRIVSMNSILLYYNEYVLIKIIFKKWNRRTWRNQVGAAKEVGGKPKYVVP
jgi:hypothetical protein